MTILGPTSMANPGSSFQGHFMNRQLALIAMTMMIGAGSAAKADDSGLASIHAWKNEPGRRVCMADHFHDGSGSGKTQKDAEAAAQSSWRSFTIFEYGTDWGSYKLSVSQKMECGKSGEGWSCSTSSRPCKMQSGAKVAKVVNKRSRSTSR